MGRLIDLSGQRFGGWTAVAVHPERFRRCSVPYVLWLCRCDCGTERLVLGNNLRRGMSTNCGCIRREKLKKRSTKHGMRWTRVYWIWCAMLQRCFNPNDKRYADYGGCGSTRFEEWLNFQKFFFDIGGSPPRPSLRLLDKKDPSPPRNFPRGTPPNPIAHPP